MQPYFLPYIGYFQLISAVDQFVVYDQIQYTKKGWVNRNRYLRDGKSVTFSIPLTKASDYLDIRARDISPIFDPAKMLAQIKGAYMRAPERDAVLDMLEPILTHKDPNLFGFILNSLQECCKFLGIDTPLVISSTVETDPTLTGQDRVIGLCKDVGTASYINAIGGTNLYSAQAFEAESMELRFLRPELVPYDQGSQSFEPGLSILDVMMFNDTDTIQGSLLPRYSLIA